MGQDVQIGVVGTGFVSRHFVPTLRHHHGYEVGKVLTRRDPETCHEFPLPGRLTRSLDEMLGASDVILECSGDPIYATEIIDAAVATSIPVVTVNAEFHVTAGSYFVGKGLVTEAEGDQPGSEAALREEALEFGFRPLVYGNMKGFLNRNPTPDDMAYWAEQQGISVRMTTSFTDGTKVQIEQALVANGLGATIARPGLLGPEEDDLRVVSSLLAEHANTLGRPISDYVLSSSLPHGVFIVAEHDHDQTAALAYLKMGDGPFYTLIKNNIFVHLEIMKTIKRVVTEGRGLLDNSADPEVSVAAIAKKDLAPGTKIPVGIGSFELRGEAVRIAEHPGHVPIGLMQEATIVRDVAAGAWLILEDVELPNSPALRAWRAIEDRALRNGRSVRDAVPDSGHSQ